MYGVGAEVLGILVAYGSMESPHRTNARADAMKVILIAYQQLAEEELPPFLMVLFEACISVLRYNGLPNHSTPKTGSNTGTSSTWTSSGDILVELTGN